eukprot:3447868-Ditylum_brightwellii.AAC.1
MGIHGDKKEDVWLTSSWHSSKQIISGEIVRTWTLPCPTYPGLWCHKWCPVTFVLVVDKFGVKVTGNNHGNHLINALKEHYEITVNNEEKVFCGIHLDWDYNNKMIDLDMLGYIAKARTTYNHDKPRRLQHSPHKHIPTKYRAKTQWTEEDSTEPLTKMEIKRVHDIVSTLLYYSQAVDSTLAAALRTIASQQANATKKTEEVCHQLLDYVAMHPNAAVRFMANDMILAVHSDALYLSKSNARSQAAGHFYLATKNNKDYSKGAILTLSTIIQNVV